MVLFFLLVVIFSLRRGVRLLDVGLLAALWFETGRGETGKKKRETGVVPVALVVFVVMLVVQGSVRRGFDFS